MTIRVKKGGNGNDLNLKLTTNNVITIVVALAPLYGLLINLNVKQATQAEVIDAHKIYIVEQTKFNRCVENAFAIEFGKNIYFYNNQLVYRGNKTQ